MSPSYACDGCAGPAGDMIMLSMTEASSNSRLTDTQLAAVRSLVDARLGERLHVSKLATATGLSASCFARLFKQTTGETPHAFITRRRIARAVAMIEQGDASLAEIAVTCGFADQAHFTRSFRAVMGQTPAKYCRVPSPGRSIGQQKSSRRA